MSYVFIFLNHRNSTFLPYAVRSARRLASVIFVASSLCLRLHQNMGKTEVRARVQAPAVTIITPEPSNVCGQLRAALSMGWCWLLCLFLHSSCP